VTQTTSRTSPRPARPAVLLSDLHPACEERHVRTNHPSKAAEPRHRKTGPARLGGDSEGGKRAR
jgi:hypothetical protein